MKRVEVRRGPATVTGERTSRRPLLTSQTTRGKAEASVDPGARIFPPSILRSGARTPRGSRPAMPEAQPVLPVIPGLPGLPGQVPDDGLTPRQRRHRPLLAVHTG